MKQVVLAILLTSVAAFIGLMSGVLIAETIFPYLMSPPGPGGLVNTTPPRYTTAVMVGLPTFGTIAGVVIGWVLILRMNSPAYEAHHCQSCGYDLNKLISNQCPECGAMIPDWQQRRLNDSEQDHA